MNHGAKLEMKSNKDKFEIPHLNPSNHWYRDPERGNRLFTPCREKGPWL